MSDEEPMTPEMFGRGFNEARLEGRLGGTEAVNCRFCGQLGSAVYFRRPICGQCSEHLAGLRRKRQRRRKAGATAK